MTPCVIRVTFETDGFTPAEQHDLLLRFERLARTLTQKPAVVLASRMGDDSRLRAGMTPAERAKL